MRLYEPPAASDSPSCGHKEPDPEESGRHRKPAYHPADQVAAAEVRDP
jgi:hypothetical protein